MTSEDWAKLQPDDLITSFVGRNQILPVRLAVLDHSGRWIGYRLNNRREPVATLLLSEKPAIWQLAVE